VELIAQGRINVQPIFNTPAFEIDEAPTAFNRCIHEKETVMKVIIKLRQDAHKLAEEYCK
jgi:threonine dehydrogenase-like Zn-dependent dehydrogenase